MGKVEKLITLENRCPICKNPHGEKVHHWEDLSGKTFQLCAVCYGFLSLPNELKRSFIERVKEARSAGETSVDSQVCGICNELRNVKDVTLYITGEKEGMYICTTCIERGPLTAEMRMALRVSARLAKEAVAADKVKTVDSE